MTGLDARLAALTPEQRALFEARLKQKGLTAPRPQRIQPIPNRERLESFPTSLDQERLWFIDQMEPGNPAYNIHQASRLFGPIDAELMRRAVNASLARHEVLRTTFRVVDGRPVQVVAPSLEIDVPVTDLSRVPDGEREAAALRAAVQAAAVRFDLERGPLVRVGLARLGPGDHVLTICMHHAVTDRFSFDIFEHEISRIYVALRDGGTAELPRLPIQFADFAAWQREELSGERLERHLAYWRDKLAGAPPVLEIPTDRRRPPVQTFQGARATIVYPDALLVALKAVAREANATMFMTMLAALDVLCWKYTSQRDLIIGSAIADRNRSETENVIGYFLNMLLLRATLDPVMSFRQLLAQVRETALGAYAHQDVPFATLVAELRPRQDPSRNPLIQVSFIYLDFPVLETPEYAGLSSAPMDVDNGASRFDMTLACTELPGTGIHGYIEYNTDLYDRLKVERMLRHLGRILESVAAEPDRPLGEIEMLTAQEREGLTVRFNDTVRQADDACLHELFERAVTASPDQPALVFGRSVTTGGRLDAAANRLARRLREAGVGAGSLVPVCAERSPEQVVAVLAVLKAGGAYAPLDAGLPSGRLASMLADLSPTVVLVQRRLAPAVPQTGGAALLEIEPAWDESLERRHETPPLPAPGDLAYVMFTSGSTGAPKGVMVPHRAIVNRLRWAQERYPIRPGERVLHNSSFGFDIAVWELFGPLLAGGTVVLPREGEHKDPAALARLVRDERVAVAHFVPSLLRPFLDAPELAECRSLRAVFCGGEGMDRELHDRFFERLPGRTLAHFYGPTEAAISCLAWDCGPGLAPGAVPLGRPVANTRVYLLDSSFQPVPVGVPGEIAIGGVGLARGYLARPDLTSDRFVPDPISGEAGARLYRTGDVAKFRDDGVLEFLGRSDHQIKIRGHRIEPGEIETALERIPNVRRAVAVARGEGAARRLVAYLVADGEAPDESALRAALRRSLPEVMIPAAFVALDELPLGAHGKVDRAALPEPGAPAASSSTVAPRTPAEELIARIWAELLRRDRVGVEDNFFDLGGDSLLATQVVSRVRSAFGVDLPLRRFFEGSTVAALAGMVEALLVDKLRSMPEEEAARLLHSEPGPFQQVSDEP
ncbi:MAG: amino acid adenylation domain-containing protein [Candidatus Eisenbacteria bacterium]|uniref:Amino acid adenylation domain-containing protein n=1 Tax=Eiseniibacteriota bacterium TaxID=2212470 RepID=A0A538TPB8_UNCEI|nr:MAG: amino acid adenylation domain-containing protein [Candidatus Eisenbacteria bacterium]